MTVILLSSCLASNVQDSWGRVQVTGIKIPAHNGQWVAGDLYRPRSATAENPAPLVVVMPGFSCIPMAELSQALFRDVSSRVMTWLFRQRMNTAVMLWAVLSGLVAYAITPWGRPREGSARLPG
jgi:hypothetical protein